jgi:hypothetical protein
MTTQLKPSCGHYEWLESASEQLAKTTADKRSMVQTLAERNAKRDGRRYVVLFDVVQASR